MIRVALVDDQAIVRSGLARILGPADGFEVIAECANGREAVDKLPALRPDVVLMDIVLPVIDGVEATREIRRRQPTIPVVAITGSEYEERALEMRDAGAVDFVRKGRLGPDLVDIVVAAAHRRRRRRRDLRASD
jgi:DNA-binding NarL/FixJ family response regulator